MGSSPGPNDALPVSFYLMKAEPDSRVVNGKDVKLTGYGMLEKFSVEDFEKVHTTAWEGVRNYAARNIMQGMKVGDKVLFYHSSTKIPGIAAYAEVSKEAYPDHTAWDKSHPYYDAKSNPLSPKWHMVELRFISRVPHFVSLAHLRYLSTLSEIPAEMAFLNNRDLKAIKDMVLLNKGRLSVQPVEKEAWEAINKIANEGYSHVALKAQKKAKGVGKRKEKRTAMLQIEKEGVLDTSKETEEGICTRTRDKWVGKRKPEAADETRKSKRAKK